MGNYDSIENLTVPVLVAVLMMVGWGALAAISGVVKFIEYGVLFT